MLVDQITEGLQPTLGTRIAGALRRTRYGLYSTVLPVEEHSGFVMSFANRMGMMTLGKIVEEATLQECPSMPGPVAHHAV